MILALIKVIELSLVIDDASLFRIHLMIETVQY